uniref:RRM domain-containing protein n=1 Tax=Meleagris gallopavo TaxID=9103 RepID=G1N7A1_MELGA
MELKSLGARPGRGTGMENSQLCKLSIGGLNVQTTEAGLREHFAAYGTLTDCVVVLNPQTKRSRCFGFVTYSAVEEADAAMAASPHAVDGNSVELKRAVSREDSAKPGAHAKVKKLFVGGLKGDVGEGDLVQHFSQFGPVEKAEIIADKQSGKKRGFGFVYFQNHDAADKAAVVKFHPIQGHRVEVKKASELTAPTVCMKESCGFKISSVCWKVKRDLYLEVCITLIKTGIMKFIRYPWMCLNCF